VAAGLYFFFAVTERILVPRPDLNLCSEWTPGDPDSKQELLRSLSLELHLAISDQGNAFGPNRWKAVLLEAGEVAFLLG
jgi:hypothetical protein